MKRASQISKSITNIRKWHQNRTNRTTKHNSRNTLYKWGFSGEIGKE